MSAITLPDILRSVEVMYDPTVTAGEKMTASSILSQVVESMDYMNIAITILQSNDPCKLYLEKHKH